eukprot:2697156-Pyramimonas_sp.AAC.1
MAARFLREAGGFSQAVQPGTSLIPGSSGAVDLGRAALHFVCRKIATGRPLPTLHTWVDDI